MQTFLPHTDFRQSLECLDPKRLGKQRVEAYQIIQTIIEKQNSPLKGTIAWAHHPAVLMWENSLAHLIIYYNTSLLVWEEKGYQNIKLVPIVPNIFFSKPPWWLGYPPFHASHRSNLLRKDSTYYRKYGWKETSTLEYFWPTSSKHLVKERS